MPSHLGCAGTAGAGVNMPAARTAHAGHDPFYVHSSREGVDHQGTALRAAGSAWIGSQAGHAIGHEGPEAKEDEKRGRGRRHRDDHVHRCQHRLRVRIIAVVVVVTRERHDVRVHRARSRQTCTQDVVGYVGVVGARVSAQGERSRHPVRHIRRRQRGRPRRHGRGWRRLAG